jgi:predicted SprT family Zn-dependent metalloprotease
MQEIYEMLALHQKTEQWELQGLFIELQRWSEIFNLEFKLQIPQVSLYVDRLPLSRLGHFRYGQNGFGLRGELAINRRYIKEDQFWKTLGTLLHELLHCWQQAYGKSGKRNYHNKEFREKAKSLGLIVDHRGYTEYDQDSPFQKLLEKNGIQVPNLPHTNIVAKKQGNSKLKKWSCGCTNVRVAVELQAQCLRCGNKFEMII